MTSNNHDNAELEAIQVVLDRVGAYQDGAPEGTVEGELRKGFEEAGIDLAEDDLVKLASAIEDQRGTVDAAAVLG